jgi:hypothetical protein
MALEIKLSPSWLLINNEYSVSGVILIHKIQKKGRKPRFERTYHKDVIYALKYYAQTVINKNEKKVTTVREYLDEFDSILEEAAKNVKEAQKYYETSNEDTDK